MKRFSTLILFAFIIGNVLATKCPYKSLGFKCCKNADTKIVHSNKFGDWGVENGKECIILDDSCWSLKYGYLCCSSDGAKVVKTDKRGQWGREIGKLCGIKNESKTLQSHMFTNGGSGPYKAVMTEEEGLPDFTFYRPKDLNTAVDAEGRLPVILYANGGCTRFSVNNTNFLTDIASHGYVVTAIGPFAMEDHSTFTFPFTDEEIASMESDANGLIDVALVYLEEKNKDKSSIFYKKLKTDKIAAMGYSCGGLQALIVAGKKDKRIKTTVTLNSGANSPGDLLDSLFTKDELKNLTGPILYITGGEEDPARLNAIDDYERIEHVPAVLATKSDVGHEGTYNEPNGGAFSKMTTAWLDYILKKDKTYDKLFRKGKLPNDFETDNWTLSQKNFN